MTCTTRRRTHREASMASLCLTFFGLACTCLVSQAFAPVSRPTCVSPNLYTGAKSPSSLNVWWFGGSEKTESMEDDADSCELVAVRIEKSSPNSRKIAGDITVPAPLKDVWAILTDYDRLAVHVPNLIESRILPSGPRQGEPGDGQFRCRLFQRGAQKIIGFEFGASLTMEMTENILPGEANGHPQARKIDFRCVESPFFSGFDGEWRVVERTGEDGNVESIVSYVVDVRPRGPVPVAALEWRIREDVPTNLRAVKRAAVAVGYDGVMATRRLQTPSTRNNVMRRPTAALRDYVREATSKKLTPVPVPGADWFDDETMAAYLKD